MEEDSSNNQAMMAAQQQQQRAGRSVLDYSSEAALRTALEQHEEDWRLPVADEHADEEDVNVELRRLLTLQSYLLLDAEQEEALDRLTQQARLIYNVPTCLISLVDLGRQFFVCGAGGAGIRETPRSIAFCSHTILSRTGICVVKDTRHDERFRDNPFVTQPPYLRFYAGAPLISPEGYKLGTFCVEGPEPRPQGLTHDEQEQLKELAAQAMQYMVQRRQTIRERLRSGGSGPNDDLRRHAAICTNLGGWLYKQHVVVAAMKLYQESVQTLMYVEEEEGGGKPAVERQEELACVWEQISNNNHLSEEDSSKLLQKLQSLTLGHEQYMTAAATTVSAQQQQSSSSLSTNGIPGLFLGVTSNSQPHHGPPRHEAQLVFAEPFQISLQTNKIDGVIDRRNFIIPLEQSSKATLFNMGLIHYHAWNSPDSALQFFDLAASLSRAAAANASTTTSALSFDPVVLACLNNMAQIQLQYGRANAAMELLGDALVRGNAVLTNMYTTNGDDEQTEFCSLRLRRKLARTILNMGHVHYYHLQYTECVNMCRDALRLLHATCWNESEAAAAWYNLGLVHLQLNQKTKALEYMQQFTSRARELVGPHSTQLADGLARQGQILLEMGFLHDALRPLNEALCIRLRILGPTHQKVSESYCWIGRVLLAREEFEFAHTALQSALAALQSRPGGSMLLGLDAAHILLEMGRCLHLCGNKNDASLKVYAQVLELAQSVFGKDHVFCARIARIMGHVELESGYASLAMRSLEHCTRILLLQQDVAASVYVLPPPPPPLLLPLSSSVAACMA